MGEQPKTIRNPVEIVILPNQITEILLDWKDFSPTTLSPLQRHNELVFKVKKPKQTLLPWCILNDYIYWSTLHRKFVVPVGTTRTVTLQAGVILGRIKHFSSILGWLLPKMGKTQLYVKKIILIPIFFFFRPQPTMNLMMTMTTTTTTMMMMMTMQ